MKNKKRTKLLALALSMLMLILGVTACGKTDEATGSADSGDSVSVGETVDSSEASEPVEIEMFVDHSWWSLKDWSGSVPEEITKKTGVKLKITVAADDNQLPLMIASGDLPELVFTDKEISRLSNSELCYDWGSLIEEYAPDFVVDKSVSALYTQEDGKYYTLLNNYSTQQEWEENEYALPSVSGICFREDIMNELGNPSVTSFEEFEALLAQVKEKYPDMIPLVSADSRNFGYFNAQFGLMDTGCDFYVDGNNTISHKIKEDGKLDFYKYINKLYNKGYITAENFTYSEGSPDAQNLVESGKAFAIADWAYSADRINANLEQQGKEFRMVPLENAISPDVKFYNVGIGWSGVFITKNNKHLEESINFMKYMFTEEGMRLGEWGIPEEHWTMSSGGYPEFKYDTQDQEFATQNGMFYWGLLSGSAVTEGLKNYDPNTLGTPVMSEMKKYMVYNPSLGLLTPPADSDEKIIQTKIKDLIVNEQAKIYTAGSEQEVEDAYNELLKKAEDLGMAQLESWANTKYQEVQSFMK